MGRYLSVLLVIGFAWGKVDKDTSNIDYYKEGMIAAKKKLYYFYIWGLGNVVYIFYGFIINAFPIMAMSVFVLIMNIYGYFNWVKDFEPFK